VLASVVGLPFQVALAIGFCAGLAVHFTMLTTAAVLVCVTFMIFRALRFMSSRPHRMTRVSRPATSSRRRGWAGSSTHILRGSGLLGQSARYVLTGGTVTVVYLGTTTALASVVGLPFQVALAIGYCAGLSVHFSMQRFFVWAHHEEYALPLHHQAARYLALTGIEYGLTAASTALLPGTLGVSVEIVYLGTVAALVSVNFMVFRNGIFHPKTPGP
jgi:putative flippase GtrA